MRILLSPAKKMRVDRDSLPCQGLPVFLDRTREILSWMQSKTPRELQALWSCNDDIARQNVERLRDMDLEHGLTPAILSYDGIAYQYMAPAVFEDSHLRYVQEHLRILSGFYGVLRPMDGVCPYRLEMQARAPIGGHRDLYDFWGDALYREVREDVMVNLASKEYYKCIQKYLTSKDHFITCTFCEMVKGKLTQKATFAKMARGEMVRYLAEVQAEQPEEMKNFDRLGYRFREDLSGETEYIFERIPQK